MVEEQEFRKRVEEIGRLLADLDQITDSHTRNSARELVQLVMDLHSTGIEKIMEVIFEHGASGKQIIEKLGCNRMAGILLALHGLHPDLLEKRVERAIGQVAARLRKQAVEVQLVSVASGVMRVRYDEQPCLRVYRRDGARRDRGGCVRNCARGFILGDRWA